MLCRHKDTSCRLRPAVPVRRRTEAILDIILEVLGAISQLLLAIHEPADSDGWVAVLMESDDSSIQGTASRSANSELQHGLSFQLLQKSDRVQSCNTTCVVC